jgi:hypothetical protein
MTDRATVGRFRHAGITKRSQYLFQRIAFPEMETNMTDPANSFAEAQINLSDALFRLWMQPLQFTQAALAAGSALVVKASDSVQAGASVKPEVEAAAEEKIAHLDEEIDRAVPEAAAIVA